MKAAAVWPAAGLPKLTAHAHCPGKAPALLARLRNKREHPVEMVLKKVLKQAGGHGHSEILIGVGTPFACETPHFIRVLLDMLRNLYDRLPARVQLVLGRFLASENPLRFPYGVVECHIVSQRQA